MRASEGGEGVGLFQFFVMSQKGGDMQKVVVTVDKQVGVESDEYSCKSDVKVKDVVRSNKCK